MTVLNDKICKVNCVWIEIHLTQLIPSYAIWHYELVITDKEYYLHPVVLKLGTQSVLSTNNSVLFHAQYNLAPPNVSAI